MRNQKLYLLSLVLIVISATTFGQVRFEGFAGVNYSNIFDINDNVNLSYSPLIGLNMGVVASYGINNNFILQTGLDAGHRGSNITKKDGPGSDYFDYKEIRATYLSIPILLNIYPLLKNPLAQRMYLQTGIAGAYNIWEIVKSGGGCIIHDYQGPGDGASFDVGFIVGAGFKMNNKMSILARQNIGLTDTFGVPTEKYYNTNTQLIFLYRFN